MENLFVCALLIGFSESARILGVFPYPSKSHALLGQPIFAELAKRGHDVVFISPFPLKNPPNGYKDIVLTEKGIFEVYENEMNQMFEVIDQNPFSLFYEMFEGCAKTAEFTIIDEAVQELLNSKTEKFDLVFVDTLMDEALLGFGAHFDAKIIGMSTLGQIRYINDLVHNPMPLSIIPNPFMSFTDRMTFQERMQNVIFTLIEDFFINFVHYPMQVSMLPDVNIQLCSDLHSLNSRKKSTISISSPISHHSNTC